MAALWLHATLLLVLLATSCPGSGGTTIEHLCGGELIDALHFVCQDEGCFFGPRRGPVQRFRALSAKVRRNIVEQCCVRGCDPLDLEKFCN